MKPGCPAQPVASYLKQFWLPPHASSGHLTPGRASPAPGPCHREGWQCRVASALPSDASVNIPASPAGSAHGAGHGFLPADGVTGAKGKVHEWPGPCCAPMERAWRDVGASSWLSHREGKLRQRQQRSRRAVLGSMETLSSHCRCRAVRAVV